MALADPLDSVNYNLLLKSHPERSYWERTWANFRLLYRGGEEFLRAAGQSISTRAQSQNTSSAFTDFMASNQRRRRFLYQLEGEPDVKYIARWERAFYLNYFAAIIDYFRHWLFSQPPIIRPADGSPPPAWWSPFHDDCTGGGTKLLDFIRDVFLDTMITRKAGWLIGTPTMDVGQLSQAQAEELGVGGCYLTGYSGEEIIDYEVDHCGQLVWIILRKEGFVRQFPFDREKVETFTYVDRNRWRAWNAVSMSENNSNEKNLELVGDGVHGLGKVPFVMLEIPFGLWPANKLANWQIDLFNQVNMLAYGQLVSCYLQPYLKTNEDGAESRVLGEGILLNLRLGRKDDPSEEFGWVSPNVDPLRFMNEELKERRDEGYRIMHQMSLAVDATVTGVVQSGRSKQEDRRASEVILAAYGGYVRDAIIRTATLISEIQGDNLKWSCEGFDNFQVSSLDEELQTAALLQTMNIPSPTFKKTLYTSIATGRILGHIDEATREKIKEEIDAAIDQDTEGAGSFGSMGFPGTETPTEEADEEARKKAAIAKDAVKEKPLDDKEIEQEIESEINTTSHQG